MRVTITDVTRMTGTNVCVAGVSRGTPVRLSDPGPNEADLNGLGGLRPGDIVDVKWEPSPRPRKPHVEDGHWDSSRSKKVGSVSRDQFVEWLDENHFMSVPDAFGQVYRRGSQGNVGFRPGRGDRSLATLAARNVEVYTDSREKIRVKFGDAVGEYEMVAVEDLVVRNHKASCRRCASSLDELLRREFKTPLAFLRIGLSREVEFPPYHPSACWLQINGIYLPDRAPKHFV